MAENLNSESKKTEPRVIDESDYSVPQQPQRTSKAIIGKGGDPLFRNIRATKEELLELLDETTTIQDWIQRETSNNVALSCLDNENLKEIYYEIKHGFGDYGPIVLMGFKSPLGVEIPRLKVYNKTGDVVEVLTGPMAIDEINRRATEYRKLLVNQENSSEFIAEEIPEYKSNI
jgi:hypothetical protein